MKQLSLSLSERTHLVAALAIVTATAANNKHAGTRMRLAKKIIRSLGS